MLQPIPGLLGVRVGSGQHSNLALTLAGSDSGAGAGIQADLKTFAAFGVYGTCAVTAVTAQNTLGVTHIHQIPPEVVRAQIDAVFFDLPPQAIKIGMLASAEIIETVTKFLSAHPSIPIVVDPVMVAKGGDRLLQEEAIEVLRDKLLPLATVLTPNADETEVLSGTSVKNMNDAREAAKIIASYGPKTVVVKGGHFGADAVDLLFDGDNFLEYPAARISTSSTHGTGCTFAAAITAGLANRQGVPEAVGVAKEFVTMAIKAAPWIGQGNGPLNHFYRWWP